MMSMRARPSGRPGRAGRGRPRRLPLRRAPAPLPVSRFAGRSALFQLGSSRSAGAQAADGVDQHVVRAGRTPLSDRPLQTSQEAPKARALGPSRAGGGRAADRPVRPPQACHRRSSSCARRVRPTRGQRAGRKERRAQAFDAEPHGEPRKLGHVLVAVPRREEAAIERRRDRRARAGGPQCRCIGARSGLRRRPAVRAGRPGPDPRASSLSSSRIRQWSRHAVEHLGQPRGQTRRCPFGHRQDKAARQRPQVRRCRPCGPRQAMRRRRVRRKAACRSGLDGCGAACPAGVPTTPSTACRTGPARMRSAIPLKPGRVDRQRRKRAQGPLPLRGRRRRHDSTSATARSTRLTELASSSGSRRSRWLMASGATRRRLGAVRLRGALVGGQRACGAQQRQFSPQPVDAQGHAELCAIAQHRLGCRHERQRGSRAVMIASRILASSACHFAMKQSVVVSKACRRRITSMRSSMSVGERTSTESPKRSRSCGRSSPSSGLPEPTSTKRAGCRIDRPSRSTAFTPVCATSSSRSTM